MTARKNTLFIVFSFLVFALFVADLVSGPVKVSLAEIAGVLAGKLLPELKKGKLRRILMMSTGALMSQTTALQGESIPGIAHLVEISSVPKEEQL